MTSRSEWLQRRCDGIQAALPSPSIHSGLLGIPPPPPPPPNCCEIDTLNPTTTPREEKSTLVSSLSEGVFYFFIYFNSRQAGGLSQLCARLLLTASSRARAHNGHSRLFYTKIVHDWPEVGQSPHRRSFDWPSASTETDSTLSLKSKSTDARTYLVL